MNATPIEYLASLRIGTVEFISPARIEAQLDIESPESVALNAGTPRNFPRISDYVMIPVDLGFVVGQVSWITIQRSPYPGRRGVQDPGLIDLPFPLRKMELQPVGTLRSIEGRYRFRRGLETFPSVGDIVILPTDEQLRSIIESGENRRVYIGNSPLMGNVKVMIDPDRLFGRHLAVLDNTGSGKSCSVAGLIRWSIESARQELVDGRKAVNSRFIVLDPNGEYSRAFADKRQDASIYTVNVKEGAEKQLEVPLWFLNTDEWCAFTKASPKTHRTTIVHALKSARSGDAVEGEEEEFLPTDEDRPIPFTKEDFVRSMGTCAEKLQTKKYIVPLMPRIKTLLADARVKNVIGDNTIQLSEWMDRYIGRNDNESLVIIDLSLLPSDVMSIITAVVARMIFEAQQRYLKLNKQCLPTVLVLEEAHYFVKRYNDNAEDTDPAIQCCKMFEKIAREGRKFGLGLVLSSQRASELSPTVLSQCNSFLLHRISNDQDQKLIHRLLPDNMRGILHEMPSFPSQHAVLLGWATELPTMVKMRTLREEQCPQSSDPDYWDVWIGKKERDINWREIANEWQKRGESLEN